MKRLIYSLLPLCLLCSISTVFAQGDWTQVASLSQSRQRHSATLLNNGKLLVAGGAYDFWGEVATFTCEVYDAATDDWDPSAIMTTPRSSHTATLLTDGRVLVTGGYAGGGYATPSCEIYDPGNDTWTAVASMNVGRYRHQAILLNEDSVLVVGGRQGNIDGYESMTIWAPLSSCEIYSISNDTWTVAGSMNELRVESGLVLLPDGRVLAAGGINDLLIMSNWAQPASHTSELYDPLTDSWSYTDTLVNARNYVRLVSLDNNTVLTVGGELDKAALNDCHLFNLDSSKWIVTGSLNDPRIVSEVLKLPNGNIMTVGGWSYLWSSQTGAAEIYDVEGGVWNSLPSLHNNRGWHTASLLNTGDIIVVGGTSDRKVALTSCEIFRFAQDTFNIIGINDGPNDEGGRVRIYWSAHKNDVPNQNSDKVSSYIIYRRDDVNGQMMYGFPAGKWLEILTVPATSMKRYSTIATTQNGELGGGNATATFVVAAKFKSGQIVSSSPVIGHSFDNRGPSRVGALSVTLVNNTRHLQWAHSVSSDIDHYAIYRGENPLFPISPEKLIGTTTSLEYTDATLQSKPVYYRVAAVDNSNNISLAALPSSSISSVGLDRSRSLRIGANFPQPFTEATTIPIWLANASEITVQIFDNLSRKVAQIPARHLQAGQQQIRISSGALPSGTYTCLIRANTDMQALTLVVQK